ncbi:MRC [Lepeophtheirus salmonis]|uniref:MRC n=1 Tax=Lepeophtheirus salmonis TaxID=72036 RepID=A0A7R8H7T3_LEPSM|nr:MRC [Lepeophtheirus salmonis]CAF2908001.1 MRC [Lepeophtheirus salmonis]
MIIKSKESLFFPDSNIQYYGVCPINFFYYPKTGLCYYKDTFTDTYVNAKEICGRMFGNRKVIDSTLNLENKRFFLGITDIKQEGHFVWENGKVFEGHYPWDDFLDCGYYSPETGWGLFTCDNKKRYLCQTKSTVHCDGDYFYYDKTSRCYKISNISVSYSAALDNCKNDISEHDTRAATISDPTLLQHILEHSDPFFVGISDREREGHFVDTNDEGYPHPPWYEDRRCKSYYYPHGWDRVNCNKEMRYICQSLREEKFYCSSGFTYHKSPDTCYRVSNGTYDYFNAIKDCQDHGGHLASFVFIGKHVDVTFLNEWVIYNDQNCTVHQNGQFELRDCNERHAYTCEQKPQHCPRNYSLNTALNICYFFSKDLRTYFEARDDCASNVPHASSALVNVANGNVKSYIERSVDYPVFVGANDLVKRDEFVWESDGHTDQVQWENDLDCGIYGNNGHDVTKCDDNHAYVCEYEPKIICPANYYKFPNVSSCFYLSNDWLNYTDARNSCPYTAPSKFNSRLASITDTSVQALIEDQFPLPIYFGLNDLSHEGYPEWDLGDPYDKNQCKETKLYGCETEPSLIVEHQDFCLPDYLYFQESNTCYHISEQNRTYEEARKYCKSRNPIRGSSLASVNKEDLIKIVSNKLGSKEFFIGLSDLKTRGSQTKIIRIQIVKLFLCETIPAYCPFGFFYFEATDTCLFYSKEKLDFYHAKNRCRSMSPKKGSHMVVVTDKRMNFLLFDMAYPDDFYIGLTKGDKSILQWDNGDEYDPELSTPLLGPSGFHDNIKKCFGVAPNYPQLPPSPPELHYKDDEAIYYNDEFTPEPPLGTTPDVHIGVTFDTSNLTLGH